MSKVEPPGRPIKVPRWARLSKSRRRAGKLPDRLDPGQAAPNRQQPLGGQDWASSANSGWLLKLSNGVVVVAVASSGVACAVMWLSVSIVKVVIMVFLCSARCAVNTWITPQGWKGNSEPNRRWRTDGDGGANAVRAAPCSAQSEPRGTISGLETDGDQERYLDTVEVWRSSRHGPTTARKVSTYSKRWPAPTAPDCSYDVPASSSRHLLAG